MKNYTRNENIIIEQCASCDSGLEERNKHGYCKTCDKDFFVFDSINKAKKKSRALQSAGHPVSKA